MNSHTIGTVLDGLNAPPFNLNLTLFSLDALGPQRLLQVLSDVLVWVQGTDPVDIRSELPEDTAVRFLNALRILKYPPPEDLEEIQTWRVDLLNGEKSAVYPILEWIFNDVDRLKERVYLANYLTHVQVPMEEQGPDVIKLMNTIKDKMEEFKALHSRIVETRGDYSHSEDIRADLKTMYEEKEHLLKRIERSKARVSHQPQLETYLRLASQMRLLVEKGQDLMIQQEEQRTALLNTEQKTRRMGRILQDAQKEKEELRPEKLLDSYKHDVRVNKYLVETKLKADLETAREGIALVKRMLALPSVDKNDIQCMHQQIDRLNQQIKDLVLERDTMDTNMEDKLSIYRHQASSVARKKGNVAEQLQGLRQELQYLEDQVSKQKLDISAKTGTQDLITGVQYKKYVTKMRTKSNLYKKKKSQLDTLSMELHVVEHTVQVLQTNFDDLVQQLKSEGRGVIEEEQAIQGSADRPKTSKPRVQDVTQLKSMVKELSDQAAEKRQRVQECQTQLAQLSSVYHSGYEEYVSKESEMKQSQDEHDARVDQLSRDIESLKKELNSSRESKNKMEQDLELSSWLASTLTDQAGAQRASEKLQKDRDAVLQETDQLSQTTRDLHNKPNWSMQMVMWKSLVQLFSAKLTVAKQRMEKVDQPMGDKL